MAKRQQRKLQNINIKPIHPVADFKPARNPMDMLKKFKVCLADVFPPGVKLTGNECKVLLVLRATAVGSSNIAAIDQEKIADLAGLRQPHVARAIIGLRSKGMLIKTWMEAGFQRYRNIYALWVPPEMLQRDAEAMLKQRDKALALEQMATEAAKKADNQGAQKNQAKKLNARAQATREKTCEFCYGKGMAIIYLPKEKIEKGRWCCCSIGRQAADKSGCDYNQLIPDDVLREVFGMVIDNQ